MLKFFVKYFSLVFLVEACCLLLSGCVPDTGTTLPPYQPGEVDIVKVSTLLGTVGDLKQFGPNVGSSHGHAGKQDAGTKTVPDFILNDRGRGYAYVVHANGRSSVFHNGKRGKEYEEIGVVTLSSDGNRVIYGARVKNKWRIVINDWEGPLFDELGDLPFFSPDSRHALYEAKLGEKWLTVVDNRRGPLCLSYFTRPEFSGDSKKILAVENTLDLETKTLVMSDLNLNPVARMNIVPFMYYMNGDKSRVAVAVYEGKRQRLLDFSVDHPEKVTRGPVHDKFEIFSFGGDGKSLASIAIDGGIKLLDVDGKATPLPTNATPAAPPVVRPGGMGAGMLMCELPGVCFLFETENPGAKRVMYSDVAELVYDKAGRHAFAARAGTDAFVVVDGKRGPKYDMVVSPEFSADGRYLVYRARKNGKRFVVVADSLGNVISQHKPYDTVHKPVFLADGQSIGYTALDGNSLWWRVEQLGRQ